MSESIINPVGLRIKQMLRVQCEALDLFAKKMLIMVTPLLPMVL